VCVVCVSNQVFSNLSRWRGVWTLEHRHRQVLWAPVETAASRRGSWLDATSLSLSRSPFPHPFTAPPHHLPRPRHFFPLEMKRTASLLHTCVTGSLSIPDRIFASKPGPNTDWWPRRPTIRFLLVHGKSLARPRPTDRSIPPTAQAHAATATATVAPSASLTTAAPALRWRRIPSKAQSPLWFAPGESIPSSGVGCERQALY